MIDANAINGRVTSIGFSQSIGQTIGFAFVKPYQKAIGSKFQIRTDNGSLVTATVAETPFIKNQKAA